MLAAVPDCVARRVHAAGQRGFRDDSAVPHRGDQVVLANYAIPASDQKFQKIEDERLDRDEAITSAEFTPIGIKRKVLEKIAQSPRPIGSGSKKQGNPETSGRLPQRRLWAPALTVPH